MPLPNADPDKRMYKLLKNIDLENLSFADFQTTAQTVFAEPEAEDTLRRIVLINLARMSVAGDWNGLTTSGGGGGGYNVPSVAIGASSEFDLFNIAMQWEGGGSTVTTLVVGNNMYFLPFIAPVTGVPTACSVYVNTGAGINMYISFYSSTNGAPATMLGYATIDVTSTGAIRVTSFTEASTGSLTFTAGEKYWYGFNKSSNTGTPVVVSLKDDYGSSVCNNETATGSNSMDIAIQTVSVSVLVAPVDVATTEIEGSGSGGNRRMLVWLEF